MAAGLCLLWLQAHSGCDLEEWEDEDIRCALSEVLEPYRILLREDVECLPIQYLFFGSGRLCGPIHGKDIHVIGDCIYVAWIPRCVGRAENFSWMTLCPTEVSVCADTSAPTAAVGQPFIAGIGCRPRLRLVDPRIDGAGSCMTSSASTHSGLRELLGSTLRRDDGKNGRWVKGRHGVVGVLTVGSAAGVYR